MVWLIDTYWCNCAEASSSTRWCSVASGTIRCTVSAFSAVLTLQQWRLCTAATPGIPAKIFVTSSVLIPRGTASMAKSILSRKRSQVPTMITIATNMPTTGSTHVQPVSTMTIPATTTPAETAASAAMWRKAARRLASCCRPRIKSKAVSVLITTPAAATAIMATPIVGTGVPMRCTASQRMAPQPASKSSELNSAA